MNADPPPLEFAPPPTPGFPGALALAIAAHALLLAVLTLGLQWNRGTAPITVEAELWSELPSDVTSPPAAVTAFEPIPPSPLVLKESGPATAAVPDVGVGLEVFQDQALQRKEKQLLDNQVELEKRRREATHVKQPEVETEVDDENMDVEGKSVRDPT